MDIEPTDTRIVCARDAIADSLNTTLQRITPLASRCPLPFISSLLIIRSFPTLRNSDSPPPYNYRAINFIARGWFQNRTVIAWESIYYVDLCFRFSPFDFPTLGMWCFILFLIILQSAACRAIRKWDSTFGLMANELFFCFSFSPASIVLIDLFFQLVTRWLYLIFKYIDLQLPTPRLFRS